MSSSESQSIQTQAELIPKPKIKFYLGGKWDDHKEIHERVKELEGLGWQCSYDWTQKERGLGQRVAAEKDIQGVKDADVCIFLFLDPTYPYRGTFTELGAALALDKKIWTVCPNPMAECRSNVFFHHGAITQYASWASISTTNITV